MVSFYAVRVARIARVCAAQWAAAGWHGRASDAFDSEAVAAYVAGVMTGPAPQTLSVIVPTPGT